MRHALSAKAKVGGIIVLDQGTVKDGKTKELQISYAKLVLVNALTALPVVRLARLRPPVAWLAHDVLVRPDRRRVFRLCRPALATMATLGFISHWNSFLAPLIFISSESKYLVAVGLRWASGSWKAASVGLAAAVMGGGLATVLTSAITGNSLS